MSQEESQSKITQSRPQAKVETKRNFSIIWVVPLVALVIGGWLAFKAMSEKGPTITITFNNSSGIEAEKTLIKFKEVEIGKVTNVELLEDLSAVRVTAQMDKSVEHLITDQTRFWVVRARVAAGQVSGLGTLFSGVYIGCTPTSEGKPTKSFKGLENPPVLTEGLPGAHFYLESETLGSLDLGSPVYYRGIKVGQVVEYHFNEDAETVLIQVFINDPFHKKVLKNTRFWNASGFDLEVSSKGIKLDTGSLVSLVLGGVAFDLRKHDFPGPVAENNHKFNLFENYASSREDVYSIKRYYMMYFDQNVRGLSEGAPVELRGIKVGEVVSVGLKYDLNTNHFMIPVTIFMEPERLTAVLVKKEETSESVEKKEVIQKAFEDKSFSETSLIRLIDQGLRGRLKTGNILTGQLYVDLDFYPNAPPASLQKENGYYVWPTISSPFEKIVERLDNILKNFEQVPVEKIGLDLELAIEELTATLHEIKNTTVHVNQETVPKINSSLDQIQKTLEGVEETIGPNSTMNYEVKQMVDELTMAIRSLRSLLDYLEREPQAFIFGKEKTSDD